MSKILTTLQRQLTEHYNAQNFSQSHIRFLFFFLQVYYKVARSQKKFKLLCNSNEGGRTVNYHTKYKRPPRAKRPPTTDRAERLTPIQGSRPTPPTSVNSPLSQQLTIPQNIA